MPRPVWYDIYIHYRLAIVCALHMCVRLRVSCETPVYTRALYSPADIRPGVLYIYNVYMRLVTTVARARPSRARIPVL